MTIGTLEMAKKACAYECNKVQACYYAILNYDVDDEDKTKDCTLVDDECGDWINHKNELDLYFYKKGNDQNLFITSKPHLHLFPPHL